MNQRARIGFPYVELFHTVSSDANAFGSLCSFPISLQCYRCCCHSASFSVPASSSDITTAIVLFQCNSPFILQFCLPILGCPFSSVSSWRKKISVFITYGGEDSTQKDFQGICTRKSRNQCETGENILVG